MENKEGNMETINYISHTHNPKVVSSNLAPATTCKAFIHAVSLNKGFSFYIP